MFDFKKEREWKKNLKVGDKVIVTNSGFYGTPLITKIERETKTLFITKSNHRFNKTTLTSPGISYSFVSLSQWTQEIENGIKEKQAKNLLVQKFSKLNWNNIPFTILNEVNKIIDNEGE